MKSRTTDRYAPVDWFIAIYIVAVACLETTRYWALGNYAFVPVIVGTIISTFNKGTITVPYRAPGIIAVMSFLAWLFVAALFSPDTNLALRSAQYVAAVYGVGFVVLMNIRNVRQIRLWVGSFVVGYTVLAVTILSTGGYGSILGESESSVAFVRQSNALGQSMTTAIAAGMMALAFVRKRARHILFAYSGLVVIVVAISGSRGSALAVGIIVFCYVSLVTILFYRRRWMSSMATLILLSIVSWIGIGYLANSPLAQKIEHRAATGGITEDARWDLYTHAWELFKHHPVVGVGLGNYQSFNYHYVYTHSALMELLVGGGVIAAIFYYSIILFLIRRSTVIAKDVKAVVSGRMFFCAAIAFLIGVCVQGAFSLAYQNKTFVLLMFIVMGASMLSWRSDHVAAGRRLVS